MGRRCSGLDDEFCGERVGLLFEVFLDLGELRSTAHHRAVELDSLLESKEFCGERL